MKILVCTNPENGSSIHPYSAHCTNDMMHDVETAFEQMNIDVIPEVSEEIANELEHNRNYWFHEQICFEVIYV